MNLMNRFIKFFTGKASTEEELELMKWAKESKANEDELLRSLRWFQTVDLLSDEEGRKRLRFPVWVRYVSVAAVMFVCGIFISQWLEYGSEKLAAMQEITVPGGQHIDLVLTDGTEVWLNSLTTLKYDPMFERDSRTVYLDGEAYFEVKKDVHKPFIVKTGKGEVKVLGTKFNVEAYSSRNEFVTSLMEGSVLLQAGVNRVLLKPNQKAIYNKESFEVSAIENMDDYSWHNGLITFTDASFGEIMQKFEKHYGYRILINNAGLNTYRCTGKFRLSDGINYALDVLRKSVNFSYEKDMTDSLIIIK